MLCSWLTARAPGMTSLDLAGMQEGFESYTSGWSREDADEDEVEDKKDRLLMAQGQQMAIFLPLLCGSLRGTSVRILVELAGKHKLVQLPIGCQQLPAGNTAQCHMPYFRVASDFEATCLCCGFSNLSLYNVIGIQ